MPVNFFSLFGNRPQLRRAPQAVVKRKKKKVVIPFHQKRLVIHPYKIGSGSAANLKNGLNGKKVRSDGTYKPRTNDIIINWGGGRIPNWDRPGVRYLNKFSAINIAKNKLKTFEVLKLAGVSIPEFTEDINIAKAWIQQGKIVLCRRLLEASQGDGIIVAQTEQQLVNAPLYVKYKKKKGEYRIHVMNGEVIDFVQKKKIAGGESDAFIRNHERGWVFCRQNVVIPDAVKEQAIKAIRALRLDFGAVDCIYNELEQKAYVLEVNSACGLEGTTIESYVNGFKKYLNN